MTLRYSRERRRRKGLLAENLVDSIQILMNPVLLGGGKRLFAGTHELRDARLSEVKQFRSGVVKLSHELKKA